MILLGFIGFIYKAHAIILQRREHIVVAGFNNECNTVYTNFVSRSMVQLVSAHESKVQQFSVKL